MVKKILWVVAIVLVAVATFLTFRDYSLKGEAVSLSEPLTAGDTLINPESEWVLFVTTVRNTGNKPIIVTDVGLDFSACHPVEGLSITLDPGETFDVKVPCDRGTTKAQIDGARFYSLFFNLDNNNNPVGPQGISSESGAIPSSSGSPVTSVGGNPGYFGNNFISSGGSGGGSSSQGGQGSQGGPITPPPSDGNGGITPPGTGGGQGSGTADLDTPSFNSISGDSNQVGFSISDSTPTISLITPGSHCRWSTVDQSYSEMSKIHACSVNVGESTAICTVNPALSSNSPSNPTTNLFVSCSDSATGSYNDAGNNLDTQGIVDYRAPVILSISPPSGTRFSFSVDGVVMTFITNEPATCSVYVSSSATSLLGAEFSCQGDGTSQHSCATNTFQGIINYYSITCSDLVAFVSNVATQNIIYISEAPSSSSAQISPSALNGGALAGSKTATLKPGSKTNNKGGSGGSTVTESPSSTPTETASGASTGGGIVAGGGGDTGPDPDAGSPSGLVIKEFETPGDCLLSPMINWFKKIFS